MTPHLTIALKKLFLLSSPALYKSKNLQALKSTTYGLTFEDDLNSNLFFNSVSNLTLEL